MVQDGCRVRQLSWFKVSSVVVSWFRGAEWMAALICPWPRQVKQVRKRWLEMRWIPLPPQMVHVHMPMDVERLN